MKRFYTILLTCVLGCTLSVYAQTADEIVAKDTIEFTSTEVTPEPNPNEQEYIFSVFSPDGKWKVQLNYHAADMYGTFGDTEFDLAGSGKNYNYIRNPKNDFSFYSFKHLDVTVSKEGNTVKIEVNGLYNNFGAWTRVLVHASYTMLQAEREQEVDLGRVFVAINELYGNSVIEGGNADYELRYGLMAGKPKTGMTYYMADLLKPELVAVQTGDTIEPLSAQLVVAADGTDEHTDMVLQLLGADLTQYNIKMYLSNEPVVARDSIEIRLGAQSTSLNFHEIYGMYQLTAFDNDYAVTLSILDGHQGQQHLTAEDLVMAYTAVVKDPLGSPKQISVVDADVMMVKAADGLSYNIAARLVGQNGILYKASMILPLDGYVSDGKATETYDFGENVLAVYYNHEEAGVLTLGAAIQNQVQVRLTFFSPEMKADTLGTSQFDMEKTDLVMIYEKEGKQMFRMVDGKEARLYISREGDLVHFNVDLLCTNDTLYHMHIAYRQPKYLQENTEVMYLAEKDKPSFNNIYFGVQYGYDMHQLVMSDLEVDDDGYPISDGFQAQFMIINEHKSKPYLTGTYGLVNGNILEAAMVYQDGPTEISLVAEAASLTLSVAESAVVPVGPGVTYKINLYNLDYKMLAKNGLIYSGKGQQACVCYGVDENDNVVLVELDEETTDIIVEKLAEQGIKVRKVMRNGRFGIVTDQGAYSLSGQKE